VFLGVKEPGLTSSPGGLIVTVLGLNFWPEPTGIAPYTSRMVVGLRDRGHAVRVVTAFPHYPQWRLPDGYSGLTSREEINGVPVKRVRHYIPFRPTNLRRALSEVTFGARLVGSRWGSPDVVVCVSPALIGTAMAMGRGLGRPDPAFGVIVQDLYSAGLEEAAAGALAERALTALETRVLRRADGVAVIHDRFKRRIVERFDVSPERIDVIRNWTHIPQVEAFDRAAFRVEMGWAPDEVVVLHAGAMGEKQGLSNVVDAARLAESSGAPVRFVLVGDGKERGLLELRAAGCQRVEFLPPLPGLDYARAMRSADVLLVNEKPGVVEMAVPSKLTSYFSTGVPVLAATDRAGTTAEELEASGAGVRIDAGDPTALVTAALRLCEDRGRAAAMGARGPAYCESLLSESAALDSYDAWVRRLHARRREAVGER
jgi:glycosyltransferase involved in cell wall biosynthesis